MEFSDPAILAPIATATLKQDVTLTTNLYTQLRSDLLNGILAPGSRLAIESLCERYLSSQTPLREALNRLTADGLVRRRESRGFVVAEVSTSDLLEITKTRCWLEEIALRESISHGGDEWEERVVVAHHRLHKTSRSLDESRFEDNPAWEPLHRDFHRSLLGACGSHWLLGFCDRLADQHYRYRRLQAPKAFVKRRAVSQEHQDLLQATLARDADLAVRLMKEHVLRTAAVIMDDLAGTDTPGSLEQREKIG